MSDQPKPTTSEWTADTDIPGLLGDERVGSQWKIICDAHNTALAAERERFMQAYRDATAKALADIQPQLAAERERFDTLQRQAEELHGRAQRAEQQLAAEREKHKPLVDAMNEALASSNPEKILRDALKEIERDSNGWEKSIALAALAKVTEGLAADREKPLSSLDASKRTFNEYVHENEQLRDQLAAEREKSERWEHVSKEQLKIVQQLRKQLAANDALSKAAPELKTLNPEH